MLSVVLFNGFWCSSWCFSAFCGVLCDLVWFLLVFWPSFFLVIRCVSAVFVAAWLFLMVFLPGYEGWCYEGDFRILYLLLSINAGGFMVFSASEKSIILTSYFL